MAQTDGVIRSGESYTIAAFRARVGIGDSTMRELIKDGLEIVEVRRKRYVLGSAWILHLEKIAANGKP